ncbi:MAG: hypothetical protein OEZ39_18795 [Gammaproteobacteria bacterium]|nr:hypothetical protein [Gammaproteobacteria bacterium]MDH5653913.1 hypothetical protein [Gammaproteobacteria bacterium]
MYLSITTMVEPTDKLPEKNKAGGSFMLTMGGLPGSQFAVGPWTDVQCSQVAHAVTQWHAQEPADITPVYKASRDNLLWVGKGRRFLFLVDLSCPEAGDPSVIMQDMYHLYEALVAHCKPYNMTVTQFMSM